MLEIVTNVVGELEDAGDDLVTEFGAYQMGRRSMKVLLHHSTTAAAISYPGPRRRSNYR